MNIKTDMNSKTTMNSETIMNSKTTMRIAKLDTIYNKVDKATDAFNANRNNLAYARILFEAYMNLRHELVFTGRRHYTDTARPELIFPNKPILKKLLPIVLQMVGLCIDDDGNPRINDFYKVYDAIDARDNYLEFVRYQRRKHIHQCGCH